MSFFEEKLLDLDSIKDSSGYTSRGTEDHRETRLDPYSHLLLCGHRGEVLCISASNTVDYIVSGGADFTLRVWLYDGSTTYYEFELTGTPCRGRVVRESDGERTIKIGDKKIPMTDLLEVTALDVQTTSGEDEVQRFIWVNLNLSDSVLITETGAKVHFKANVAIEATDSYAIHAVLTHDVELELLEKTDETGADAQPHGVTAVACAGVHGPFISGTSNGSIYMMGHASAGLDLVCLQNPGTDHITDMWVLAQKKEKEIELQGPWVLAVACMSGYVRVYQIEETRELTHKDMFVLEHASTVLKVRQMYEVDAGGVRFATCAGDSINLWSVTGDWLTSLSMGGSVMSHLTVTKGQKGCLLLAGTDGNIATWAIDPDAGFLPTDPVACYQFRGKGIDVDQGSEFWSEYAVNISEPNTIVSWELLAVNPARVVGIERIHNWWELLSKPGKERFRTEMVHPSVVTDFQVTEDDVEGPVLLSCCKNGTLYTWSLKKESQGEICGQMRSLTHFEIAKSPVLLMVTVVQLCSFAFGPATHWRKSIKTTVSYGAHVVFLGFSINVNLQMSRSDKFRAEVVIAQLMMVTFLLCEVLGAYELLEAFQNRVKSSKSFKKAELQGVWNRMRMLRWVLNILQRLWYLVAIVSSTVGVAPIFKVCAQTLRCSYDELDGVHYLVVTGGKAVMCKMAFGMPVGLLWEGAENWSHEPALCYALLLCYFIGLLPFFAVGGDASYVQRDEIFDPNQWQFNARRKATSLNLGVLHPKPQNIYRALLVEGVSKAVLPMISWLITHPLLQMSCSSALMAALFVESVRFPQYMDTRFTTIVQGCRCFILCTMLCGLVTLLLPHHGYDEVPLVLISVCFVTVSSYTIYQVLKQQVSGRKVFTRTTSMSVPAISNTSSG